MLSVEAYELTWSLIDVGTGVVDWDMNARASSKDVSIAIIGCRSGESDESFDIRKTSTSGRERTSDHAMLMRN
jgi:hypothetical protein